MPFDAAFRAAELAEEREATAEVEDDIADEKHGGCSCNPGIEFTSPGTAEFTETSITYCNLHKSAPALLAALIEFANSHLARDPIPSTTKTREGRAYLKAVAAIEAAS